MWDRFGQDDSNLKGIVDFMRHLRKEKKHLFTPCQLKFPRCRTSKK